MAELTCQLLLEKSHLLTLDLIFLVTNDEQFSISVRTSFISRIDFDFFICFFCLLRQGNHISKVLNWFFILFKAWPWSLLSTSIFSIKSNMK
jgi:hypothetical protein